MARTYYSQALNMFDWSGMVADMSVPGYEFTDKGVCRELIGTVFSVMPSGKYYTPFACSNVTAHEADRDERFMNALESVASKFGGWIESGEGDPCDLFFCTHAPETEEESAELHCSECSNPLPDDYPDDRCARCLSGHGAGWID